MTTTSGYSCKLGGRLNHYGPNQTQNGRPLDCRAAQKRTARVAVAVADGRNETAYDDGRQTVYGDPG